MRRSRPHSHRLPRRSVAYLACVITAAAMALVVAGLLATPGQQHVTARLTAAQTPPTRYYLSLGDSLSVGVQPTSTGASDPTSQGYADDLAAYYRRATPGGLQLVKLGCPGETTTSMLTGSGSPCSYPQGSQLAAAVAFIRAHRKRIALITIDIGANNVDSCASAGSIDETCVASGIASLQSDLPQILSAIRGAAGGQTLIAGMNLYDPFLAEYLTGTAGQAVAQQSVTLLSEINTVLATSDAADRIRTADVSSAFASTDFTDTTQLPGVGSVPVNVGRICTWTWMCAAAPVGPNIHANQVGYLQIAGAFEKVIGRRV